ncbi:MAG: NUDIX domain-containing protein [Candidatus Andersenbacteria bacterium]
MLTEPLITLLENYKPYDEMERFHVVQVQQFLRESHNVYDRANLLGHVVADAWIVNPARTHVVLIEHGMNKKWMAPGGHCDGNSDVHAAAMREAEEETGLTNLKPLLGGNIYDVNVGNVPGREKHCKLEPSHLHFDICFAFEAPDNAPLIISHESDGLKWVALDELKNLETSESHYRRPLKTLAGFLK